MADAQTLGVYAEQAATYAKQFENTGDRDLDRFMSVLPPGGRVLDLGSGPGKAAAILAERGFLAEAWDASPEFVEMARATFGIDAQVAEFADLDTVETYDGIYANFSLLHAPKAEMPDHLSRIAKALKPAGRFHIGTKTGTGERRDALGRFYAFYEEAELTDLLGTAGLAVDYRRTGAEPGLDGVVAPWIILQAVKNG